MRWTESLIPTLREVSKEAEATSHQLLLKGGFIRKLASGIYSYLPLGLRVLQNISAIVREEMNLAGGIELLLPSLHPAEIWKQSGRYETLGQDKIAFKNRSNQEYVLGPTHEEVITELAGAYLKTYQSLPKILYQIQTKFRDELRPRFGIIRTKEFIMKDAYSFDLDDAGLDHSYQLMYRAYERIFKRFNLAIDIVGADPGIMGGNVSHEFMVRSPYGEDRIAACSKCDYRASRDIAARKISDQPSPVSSKKMESVDTPNLRTVDEITHFLKIKPQQILKTLLFFADEKPIAACIRGDREVHEGKLRRLLGSKSIRLATSAEIETWTGTPVGFTGPVGLKNISIVIDAEIATGADFVSGANQKDKHFKNVNLNRDFKYDKMGDIRYAEEGDLCVQCGSPLSLITAMEVGHVFKLGTRYTNVFSAHYRAQDGTEKPMIMGCYGLGLNRIVAALVEQHHDQKGMCWPYSVAPYQIQIITINQQNAEMQKAADEVYHDLTKNSFSCLYDDRDERAGVKFNDADLIGTPIHVIISDRNLSQDLFEVKLRKSQESHTISKKGFLDEMKSFSRQLLP